MPGFSTISAINTVTREQRTTREEWVFFTTPVRKYKRDITHSKIEYVGINNADQARLRKELKDADTTGAIVDLYFVKGPATTGTIFMETLISTEWEITVL